MRFSCYIILYSDYGFLDDVFKSIYNYVDEIIVVDGPYSYCTDQLKKLNLLYDENNKPIELNNILNKYSQKINYFYNTWKDEKEKRMFGYDKCSGDIVMLVDSDEIYSLDINKIQEFYNSNKYVSSLRIYNMCRHNIYMNDVEKFILFKKKYINSLEHLSYTWLVGVSGLVEKKQEYMDIKITNRCGTIYHQTLNREKEFNIIKFIFYNCLSYYNNCPEKIDYISNLYTFDKLLNIMTIDEIKNIFYKSYFPSINLPLPENNTILRKLNNIDINLLKYSNNILQAYFTPNLLILNNLKCIFYLQEKYYINNTIDITFKTVNIDECIINCYDICLDKLWDKYSYNVRVENNQFNIKHKLNKGERINYAIELTVKTIDGIKGFLSSII